MTFQHIIFIKIIKKLTFLMDCSLFQNHGKDFFSFKKQNATNHGSHFDCFLPFASLNPTIYGHPYGIPLFL